jgi:RNA 3'-terminal phosphate cyclase (ATP)
MRNPVITIDGAQGEGGGQVLRSALTLSLVTGKKLEITNIRARRSRPGLRPQHLKAVEAAAAIGRASVVGASLGSTSLVFTPGTIQPGHYQIDIGTAGSTSLVLQTIFLPLSLAQGLSKVMINGGTHVPMSPCYHYIDQQWLAIMRQIGFDAQLTLLQAGFYPQGGGRLAAEIRPCGAIKPLQLLERGALEQIRGISAIANLDRKIAERQRNRVLRRLGDQYRLNDIRIVYLPSLSKGTMLLLVAEFEFTQCCYFALGELGKPAERVADEAVDSLLAFLETGAAVDQYMADQLLLPLAFADGPSALHTSKITNHLITNAQVLRAFLSADIEISGEIGQPGTVRIDPIQE